jgi:hypothetical protein
MRAKYDLARLSQPEIKLRSSWAFLDFLSHNPDDDDDDVLR